jgi:hypothetical protein
MHLYRRINPPTICYKRLLEVSVSYSVGQTRAGFPVLLQVADQQAAHEKQAAAEQEAARQKQAEHDQQVAAQKQAADAAKAKADKEKADADKTPSNKPSIKKPKPGQPGNDQPAQ